MRLTLIVLSLALLDALAEEDFDDEACGVPPSREPERSLLQVRVKDAPRNVNALALQNGHEQETKACSYQLIGDQDGSRPCQKPRGKEHIFGKNATLDEDGYEKVASLCCHHEMSYFVRNEIKSQGFDVCDLSDLHGFVHWYDCENDKKTYAELKDEIAGVMTSICPWLGHLPDCPKKDPFHCGVIAEDCHLPPPAGSKPGAWPTPLSESGYAAVALNCCHKEMKKFILREIERQQFHVCDEGSLNGFLHWYDCTSDDQTYEKLMEGLVIARSGLPPMCPWLGSDGEACPPQGHNCPVVEPSEPTAHRRRHACR